MSIRLIAAVFASTTLGATERLVLLALADHANDKSTCYPSIGRLAQRTGLSERAVQTNIRKLTRSGHVRIINGGGKRKSNHYHITANPAADAPQTPHQIHPTPAADAPEPSGTIIGTSTEALVAEKDAAVGLISLIMNALELGTGTVKPNYWLAGDSPQIVQRWKDDLGLTDEQIIAVAVSNMRLHGSAAKGPKVLNRAMDDHAAALSGIQKSSTPRSLAPRKLASLVIDLKRRQAIQKANEASNPEATPCPPEVAARIVSENGFGRSMENSRITAPRQDPVKNAAVALEPDHLEDAKDRPAGAAT